MSASIGEGQDGLDQGPCTSAAAQMAAVRLEKDDTVLEARWNAMSDAELDEEIAGYRDCIAAVSSELKSLGVAICLDDDQERREQGNKASTLGLEVRIYRLLCCCSG